MGLAFLTTLAGGMLATLSACPVRQVSPRFVRLVILIVMVLLVGPLVWMILRGSLSPEFRIRGWVVLGAAVVLNGVLLATMLRLPGTAGRLRVMAGFAASITLYGVFLVSKGLDVWPMRGGAVATLAGFNLLFAAAVLGTVTLSWLLGHAYLTASDISLAPLRRLGNLFFGAVLFRCAFALISFAVVWSASMSGRTTADPGEGMPTALGWTLIDVLYLTVRVGVGLLPLPILAWMMRDCIKARNTQSTTGVLYFASVLAYAGELASLHVTSTMGLPL